MKYIPELEGKGENVFVPCLRSSNKCVIEKTDFTYGIFLFHYKATNTAIFSNNYYFCLIYQ